VKLFFKHSVIGIPMWIGPGCVKILKTCLESQHTIERKPLTASSGFFCKYPEQLTAAS